MEQPLELNNAGEVAAQIEADIRALPVRNTATVRAVRRRYSRILKRAEPAFILDLAQELIEKYEGLPKLVGCVGVATGQWPP